MEDYLEKIEKLPTEKLVALVKVYQATIKGLQEQYDQAMMVAMITVADYTQGELTKKKSELGQIEQMIKEREVPETK